MPNSGDADGSGSGTQRGTFQVHSSQSKDRKASAGVAGFDAKVGLQIFAVRLGAAPRGRFPSS